jgi:hypothetical protein
MSEPNSTDKKKIKHIVCAGGGHNGFNYYGVLKELNIKKFWNIDDIQTIHATSIGSIISIMVALRFEWDVLDDYLVKRPWNTVYKMNMYSLINAFDKKGIFDINVIKETFLPLFKAKDISIDITMAEFYELTKIEIHHFTTNMNTFETIDISYKTHPDWKVVESAYCSSALPILMSPYFKDSNVYYDGGILSNYPIDYCLNKQCGEIHPDEILAIKMNNLDNLEFIEEEKTLIDFLILLFLKMFLRLTKEKNNIKLKNEIIIHTNKITFDDLFYCLSSQEERKKRIDKGIQIANDFLTNLEIIP